MDKELEFKLSLEETNLIFEGLALLPLGKALNVFNKLQQQGQAQMQPPMEAPEETI